MSRKNRRQSRKKRNKENQGNLGGGETPRRGRSSDFNPDYSYVRKDLKRIGILAGIFLAFLVGLSFLLN